MVLDSYYGQDLTWLQSLRTTLREAIQAVAMGRTVTVYGKSVGREAMNDLALHLRAVEDEIRRQEGTQIAESRVIHADFSGATSSEAT